jgi:hypothetical protein
MLWEMATLKLNNTNLAEERWLMIASSGSKTKGM